MDVWALLFRAINVGGRGVLPMADLRAALRAAGFSEPRTILQSGNALVRAHGDAAAIASRAAAALRDPLAGDVPEVVALTPDELGRAIADGPFAVEAQETPGRVHLFFCLGDPAEGAEARLEALREGAERFALDGRILHLHAPAGIGRSRLVRGAERAMGRLATARSVATLAKIVIAAAGMEAAGR